METYQTGELNGHFITKKYYIENSLYKFKSTLHIAEVRIIVNQNLINGKGPKCSQREMWNAYQSMRNAVRRPYIHVIGFPEVEERIRNNQHSN